MLSREQNDRLTRVGPGTPCGELLRRYWQPLCGTEQVDGGKRKRVRLLGEDLLAFKAASGEYGCVQEQCPHRNASLYFGFLEPDGIRCCYHGWKYQYGTGTCIERPFETAAPHAGTRLPTYRVQELGGLLFVYMGPDPEKAPLLPRWDVMVRDDQPRKIVVLPEHKCNWLQVQENGADSVHTYYLHAHTAFVSGMMNNPDARADVRMASPYYYRPIVAYDYATCELGIEKTIDYGGDSPEHEVRPPLIFPNIARVPQGPLETIHFRVPVDDTHTKIIWAGLLPDPRLAEILPAGAESIAHDGRGFIDLYNTPRVRLEDESLGDFFSQDRVVMETQGGIADRSRECLGASDLGIVLFRRMLSEQIELVERGEEPTIAVVRDPNLDMITFASATQPSLA
jgi:5,5'-dehydrodivanillate O-demethylase oxygenase subunit